MNRRKIFQRLSASALGLLILLFGFLNWYSSSANSDHGRDDDLGGPWSSQNEVYNSNLYQEVRLKKEDDDALFKSLNENFLQYDPEFTRVPTWILTSPNVSTIHRFFDSSPFSPSGRYLAVTRLPQIFPGSGEGTNAEIVVIDLMSGSEDIVATTTAWGAQLGSQVQWGQSDEQLFFNTVKETSDQGVAGVSLNIFTKLKHTMDCPIYHVSKNGKYTISPTITKIKHTQMGYGADYISERNRNNEIYIPNQNAAKNDGIFLGDVESGTCILLISLNDLAKLANIDTQSTPVYGFHTKWSSDSKYILFVMRSMEVGSGLLNGITGVKIRKQHLFVLGRDGTGAKRILSWSSKPYRYQGRNFWKTGDISDEYDGNHPNWIPNTYKISMNLKSNKRNKTIDYGWDVMVLDLKDNNSLMNKKLVTNRGSGHPNFDNSGRYLLLDAYAKESLNFNMKNKTKSLCNIEQSDEKCKKDSRKIEKKIPLRLLDTETMKEIWLLDLQLNPSSLSHHELYFAPKSATNAHRRAWRCDMHATWSPSQDWIVLNGRPNGANRQVLISYIGKVNELFGEQENDLK